MICHCIYINLNSTSRLTEFVMLFLPAHSTDSLYILFSHQYMLGHYLSLSEHSRLILTSRPSGLLFHSLSAFPCQSKKTPLLTISKVVQMFFLKLFQYLVYSFYYTYQNLEPLYVYMFLLLVLCFNTSQNSKSKLVKDHVWLFTITPFPRAGSIRSIVKLQRMFLK